MSAPRSILFYAAWPLGYHNIEAERKAVHLADAGFDVVYVTGVGTRNPRLSSMAKLVDRVARKVGRAPSPSANVHHGLREAGLLVLPPRQLGVVRSLNTAWVERQLRSMLPDPERSVAWIRWPTQELVDALQRVGPAAIVYESVDPNHLSPGMDRRWRPIFEDAERALVSLADLVVVPTPALAERYEAWGGRVHVLSHGVDLPDWQERTSDPDREPTLGFVGTLDYRLDSDVLVEIARRRPHWRLRLIGPVQEGFDPAAFAALANVSIEGPVPASTVAALNRSFDVGVLAYRPDEHYRHLSPLKAAELLAVGTAVVAPRNPAMERYASVIAFAATADEHVAAIDGVLASDGPDLARRRRASVEEDTWANRLAEMTDLIHRLL